MTRIFALLLFLLPGFAAAEPFPALYDVVGVAANDVLNVREAPAADTAILGMLAPGARDIEVVRVSDDRRWGLVNTGDLAGWVSLHYMARHPGQEWGMIPANLHCGGTEPFWSFDLTGAGTAQFSDPDQTRDYAITTQLVAQSWPGDFAFVTEGASGRATAFVASAFCNDGMSNREYGLTLGLLLEGAGRTVLHTGCCSLQR